MLIIGCFLLGIFAIIIGSKIKPHNLREEETFMVNIDYTQLKNILKGILHKVYNEYTKEHGLKNICGFSLYSDLREMSISINTYKNLENSIKKSEDILDCKFKIEKWEQKIEAADMESFNKKLLEYNSEMNKRRPINEVIEYENNIYKLSVEALAELRKEQCFKELKDDFILLVSVETYEIPNIVLEYNMKNNSKTIADEYYQWAFELNDMNNS
ncbi:hypothetical protein FACS189475_07220 [Betaproteobacteria bacterium]|nr:hypothetical protein FACS189475_07220 [Betaproteobacteria bacterium]